MCASHLSRFLAVPLTFLSACSLWLRAQIVTVRPEAGPFDPARLSMEAPPRQGCAVRAGRMFDAKAGRNLTSQVILVKDGRIADVGPADRVQIPQGAKVIDLSRATVLPGLIDRHVHLMQETQPNDARLVLSGLHYALKDLYAGFTTLQDMNSSKI